MKLFISGISGLLGLNLAQEAKGRFEVSGCFYDCPVRLDGVGTFRLDLRSLHATQEAFGDIKPHVVINAAGLANVDGCETQPKLAHQLNVEAARNAAVSAAAVGARLVHISTDQLFDGCTPWRTETDQPTPRNTYALTKWQAEQAVSEACPDALILRTNFFGWGTSARPSFSDWVLSGLEQNRQLPMFSDAFFTPILINDLAGLIFSLVERGAAGTFNVSGSDRLSKHEFALKAAAIFGYSADLVKAARLEDVPLKAARPKDMSLSSRKTENLLDVDMPGVDSGLERLCRLGEKRWQQSLEKAIQDGSQSISVPG